MIQIKKHNQALDVVLTLALTVTELATIRDEIFGLPHVSTLVALVLMSDYTVTRFPTPIAPENSRGGNDVPAAGGASKK